MGTQSQKSQATPNFFKVWFACISRALHFPAALKFVLCGSFSIRTRSAGNAWLFCVSKQQFFLFSHLFASVSGFNELVHQLTSPRLSLSLSVSPQWSEGCDGKEESEGESLLPSSLPITPCSLRARYAKTSGDQPGLLVKRKNLCKVSDQLQTFLVLRKMQFDLRISSFD